MIIIKADRPTTL